MPAGLAQAGVILRPGITHILCGKGGDSGGHCGGWCPSIDSVGKNVANLQYPGDGCGGSWRPADIGMYLQRQTAWQLANHRLEYNELIFDGEVFRAQPSVIEAYFGAAHEQRRQFMVKHKGLSPPLLELDLMNWDEPLRCVEGC